MKFYLFSLLWLSSHIAFSQIKSRVVDSETKKGIPYVNIWVENQNIGTTSDKNGDFVLHTNDSSIVIIFSSIGYAATRMLVETIKDEVILHPEPGQLEEILVTSEKKERIVGGFKKRKINSYFACYSLPKILVWKFEYDQKYESTPYIDKIRFVTRSHVKNATFNIRFFTVNADSLPSKVINSENIIGTAPKGRKIIEIDLSNHRIRLPENGIFIGFEFLIIESNKHEFVYTIKGSKKKHKGISYEPAFGLVDSETSMVCTFVNGKWRKRNIKNSLAPAIQILLVN